MVKKFDFLVIGSGLAGMSFALKVYDVFHRLLSHYLELLSG